MLVWDFGGQADRPQNQEDSCNCSHPQWKAPAINKNQHTKAGHSCAYFIPSRKKYQCLFPCGGGTELANRRKNTNYLCILMANTTSKMYSKKLFPNIDSCRARTRMRSKECNFSSIGFMPWKVLKFLAIEKSIRIFFRHTWLKSYLFSQVYAAIVDFNVTFDFVRLQQCPTFNPAKNPKS